MNLSGWWLPPDFAQYSWEPSIGFLGNSRQPLLGTVLDESQLYWANPPSQYSPTSAAHFSTIWNTKHGGEICLPIETDRLGNEIDFHFLNFQKYPSKLISPKIKLCSESRACRAFLQPITVLHPHQTSSSLLPNPGVQYDDMQVVTVT